jgi:ATP-dependent Clp endopeptidase proteolytic subunit ClpP
MFWQFIKNEATGKPPELLLYGVISQSTWMGDEVTPKKFADGLKDLGEVEEIHVRINSPGGDLFAGQAIYNLLKTHAAKITVFIDGLAASAASLIAMAGDEVIMPGNAMMMIHSPVGLVEGGSDELRRMADVIDQARETMIAVYHAKTGLDRETVIDLLDNETWFTADEAFEYGLIDTIAEPILIAASAEPGVYLINGQKIDLKGVSVWPKLESQSKENDSAPEGPEGMVTMKARALLDKIRGFFSMEKHPTIAKALDSMRLEVADDTPVEAITDRVMAMLQDGVSAAMEFADSIRALGIDSKDKAMALLENAKLGEAYRSDLVTRTLEAGVRAYGEGFPKDTYEKMLAEPGRSADDIKAFLAQFEADAKKRLGEGGRQTTPDAGKTASGKTIRDYNADEFNALSVEEQDRLIEDFKNPGKKPETVAAGS